MRLVKRLFFFSIIVLMMYLAPHSAIAADGDSVNAINQSQQNGVRNPSTDLWRAVRNREFEGSKDFPSSSQIKSMGAGTLVNTQGQKWRGFRMNQLIPFSMLLLGGVLLVLLLFRLIRGKIKIKAGRSGKKILRFSGFQRFVHWSVAILFVVLAITGTLLTFGRFGLVPLIGSKAFGNIASVGKTLHDYLGPLFAIMLIIMLFTFIKGNFGTWTDIKWFFKGGGLLGRHASAGRYNAGEKLWFWVAMIVGTVVVVSGIVLDFPFFNQTRADLELSHVVHAIASIGLLAVSFGHIFMGTIAMEGAYEAMKTGYCDENWAKEHHDLWYADLEKQGLLSNSTSKSAVVVGAGAIATGAMLKEPASSSTQSFMDTAGSIETSTDEVVTSKKITVENKPTSQALDQINNSQSDNLKKVEGIGPKIERLLNDAGITTFSQLHQSQYDELKAILHEAGARYKMHDPKTWSQQAELADRGAWEELSDLQDRLLGGSD